MAEYIEREAFIEAQRHLYCDNCERRKGMKNGKMKYVYAIGEAPCRTCDIMDMLDSIEDYPAADVAPVVHGRWCCNKGDNTPYCSECLMPQDTECNYNPDCGAKMEMVTTRNQVKDGGI